MHWPRCNQAGLAIKLLACCCSDIISPHYMHRVQRCPIAIDVAWSVCLCLLDTAVTPSKMAKVTDMPFGVWNRVGPSKHYYVF